MATAAAGRREDFGTLEYPSSNVPFLVQDPDTVWIVEEGKLDLFLVSAENEKLAGARYHVLRCEKACAVIGMQPLSPGLALVATGAPQTILRRVPLVRFQQLAQANDEETLRLLERWVTGIAAAVSDGIVSGAFLTLEPGETRAIGEEPRALVPLQQLVWVKHERGASRFLDMTSVPSVNGAGYFRLSRHGWLRADAGSEVCSVSSEELATADPEWTGFRHFQHVMLTSLAAKRANSLLDDRTRLRARDQADAALLRTSVQTLFAPIRAVKKPIAVIDVCKDPVFLACEVAGKKLGLKIKPHPDMLRGIAMADPIAGVTKASGVRVRRVTLKGTWWTQENAPIIAFRESDNSPVALLPRSRSRLDLYDPVTQESVPVNQTVANSLNPSAYVLYRPFPCKPLSIADLIQFGIRGCRGEFILILLTGVAVGLLGTITPFVTGVIFDDFIPSADKTGLMEVSIFLLVIAVTAAMLSLSRNFAVLRLEGKMDSSIQAAVWDRLLSLPVSFFRDYSSGDLAQRSLGIARIREMLTSYVMTAVLSGIFSCFSFLMLFYYSWQLALIATAIVLVASLVSVACGVAQVRQQRKLFKLQGSISSKLLQFLTGIAKFRISGTEARAFASWAHAFAEQKQVSIVARRITSGLTVFTSVYGVIGLAVLICFQSLILSPGESSRMTTGQFLAFLAAFTQFLAATLTLSSTLVNAVSIVPIYERARPIFQALPENTEAKATPGPLSGAIEVSHVTFRYKPEHQPVLHDLSVRIEPGEFVAFVGPSGSGKSTLFRLLLGFEAPESGAVYLDGQDLAGLDIQEVRRRIGVVLQSSKPVGGTIFENIVGSAPLSIEDAWEAARLAGFDDDVKRMPMGMHTMLSDGGGGISGGQKQRLLIARAIVNRPQILVFDEATSALDNRTQEIVSRSLEGLQATRIVIAHRLSTIMNANRIFVVERGRIVQSGSYQALVEQAGLFQDLAKRQLT